MARIVRWRPGPVPFVGRQQELAALADMLARVKTGHGALAFVSGEAGIGKTTLALAFQRFAEQSGAAVFWGHSWEGEGLPALLPWTQIARDLRQLNPALAGASGYQTVELLLDGRASSQVRTQDGEDRRHWLLDSLAQFFVAASGAPTLFILEDLHRADRFSVLLLQHLSRALSHSKLMVVGTYRDEELVANQSAADIQLRLEGSPGVTSLPLAAFTRDEVREFLLAFGHAPIDTQLADRLWEDTGGNPYFAAEVGRLLVSQRSASAATRGGGHLPISPTIRETIRLRLRSLTLSCRAFVDAASVLGREFDPRVATALAGEPVERTSTLTAEAETKHFLLPRTHRPAQVSAFVHEVLRETLYDLLPPETRSRLHEQSAKLLEGQDPAVSLATAALIAHHWSLADGERTAVPAFESAMRAGDLALDRYAFEEAQRLYALAIAGLHHLPGTDPRRRFEALLAHARASYSIGDRRAGGESRGAALELARRNALPVEFAQAALTGALDLQVTGATDDTFVATIREAVTLLPADEPRMLSELLSFLALELADREASRDEAEQCARRAIDLARQAGEDLTLVRALFAYRYAAWRPETISERLDIGNEMVTIGRRLESLEAVLQGLHVRVLAQEELGDLPALRATIHDHRLSAEAVKVPYYLSLSLAYRMMLATALGNFETAQTLAQELLAYQGRAHNDARVFAELTAFMIGHQTGHYPVPDGLARAESAAVRLKSAQFLVPTMLLDFGKRAEAARVVAELAASGFAAAPRDHTRLVSLCAIAEAGAEVGTSAACADLYEAISPYQHFWPVLGHTSFGPASYYLGLLAGRLGEREAARRHLDHALASSERVAAAPWTVMARLVLAELLASGSIAERSEARSLLEAVIPSATSLGMAPALARADALQQKLPPITPAGLSTREVEILAHVAAGLSNREIAEALTLSIKTVERHVANIYGKTGVHGRVEAAAFAVREGLHSPAKTAD